MNNKQLESFGSDINAYKQSSTKTKGYIALNDLKTLDKLAKEAAAYKKGGLKLRDKSIDLGLKYQDVEKKSSSATDNWVKMTSNLSKVVDEQKRRVAVAQKSLDDALNQRNKWTNAEGEAGQKWELADAETENYFKAGLSKEQTFKTQIDNFARAAKGLGLTVDVKKYLNAAELYTFF